MIDYALRWLAARYHRRRLLRAEPATSYIREWREMNPGRCMYCSYTHWANTDMGQRLQYEPHNCPEGNGGPREVPRATATIRGSK